MEKHALYSGSRNLYGDMATAAKSLIANSDVDKVWILTEDDSFDYWLPDFCEVVNVSGQKFFPPDGPNMNTQYTYMAMMRCALALMPELADVHTILSLDADTIAVRRCSEVWDLPLGNEFYFAATREQHRSVGNMMYTNIGVALLNLDLLRNGKAEEIVYALNHWQYRWIEQDCYNYLCQGRILGMPPEYNACDFIAHDFARIRHFAAIDAKIWKNRPEVVQYRRMPWEDALEAHEKQMGRRNV